jgi:hypothetical protein
MAETFINLLNSHDHEEYLNDVFAGFTVECVELDVDEGGVARSIVLHMNDGRSIMVASPYEGLVLAEAGIAGA